LEYAGRPVAPTDSFTFALNNYRQTGGGGYAMLAGSKNLDDRQLEIRQLLIDEVAKKKALRPEDYAKKNWEIVPPSAVTQALAAMQRIPGAGAVSARPTPSVRSPQSAVRTRLRIIGTNDFHGALEPRPDANGVRRGGAAYVAAAIAKAASECVAPDCQTLLLDGGDEFQGTPASNFAFGGPVVEVFNRLGLAASALGNHEFDWGQDSLRARMRQARYAILGANVRYSDGRDVPWIRNDTLVERGNLKIGIIGITTRGAGTSTLARNVVGLIFDDAVPIVDSLVSNLRRRGADLVVVIAHAGAYCDRAGEQGCAGEIVQLAQRTTQSIDAIVSGHTHSLVNTVVRGIPIVQARSSGQAIDVVDLTPGVEGWTSSRQVRDVVSDSLTPDATIQSLVASAVSAVASRVNAPVTTFAEDLKHSASGADEQVPLGNLIADAQRAVGKADVGFTNIGGIRTGIRAGSATYGALYEVQPFGNVLYRVTVRGSDLREYLERVVGRRRPQVQVSGAVVTYDTTRAAGSRIRSVRMTDGSSLTDDRTYTVVLNDFMYTGGSNLGFGEKALRADPLDLNDLDAFVSYLRSLPKPVPVPKERRFVIANGP
jgi:2',3'-cyclic-nucleotide 2'-phosphodiesterase (5'-nucleotidase family)